MRPHLPSGGSLQREDLGSKNYKPRPKVVRVKISTWWELSSATQQRLMGEVMCEPGLKNRWRLHGDMMQSRYKMMLSGEGTAWEKHFPNTSSFYKETDRTRGGVYMCGS